MLNNYDYMICIVKKFVFVCGKLWIYLHFNKKNMDKIKKVKPIRTDIRVTDIPLDTFRILKETAKKNCRSIAKEVLHLIIKSY